MGRLTRHEQQARTRAALLEAAREHFAEHGYGQASLDKIAEEAGFTRGAIYAHFEAKSGLFLAVLDARLNAQVHELEAIGADLEKLGRWRQANAQAQRGLSLAVLEFRATAMRDEKLREQLVQRERRLRRAFANLISKAADDLGIQLPLAAEQVAVALLALGDGITQQHHLDPDRVELNTFEETLSALIDNLTT